MKFDFIYDTNVPGVYTYNSKDTIPIRGCVDVILDDERENHLLLKGACYLSVDSMFPVTCLRGCQPWL